MARPLTRAGLGLLAVGTLGLVASQLVPGGPAGAAVVDGPGSALATASLLTVGPNYGGLALTASTGSASSSYLADEAQASSADLDLSSLSAVTGSLPTVSAVQPLSVDSASGPSKETGGTSNVGAESVAVKDTPTSDASAQMVALDLPGVVEVEGRATTSAAYQGGSRQTAHAAADLTIQLAGGLVSMRGVDWKADQTSDSGGPVARQTDASFTLGSISVAGVALPTNSPAQLAVAMTTVNSTLSPLGITISLPVTSVDPTSGTESVSGVDIVLGKSVLSPTIASLMGPETQVEEQLNSVLAKGGQGLASVAGDVGTGELVGAIVLGILGGAGQVKLIVGGVSADSEVAPPFVNLLGPGSVSIGGSAPPISSVTTPGPANAVVPQTVVTESAPSVAPTSGLTGPALPASTASHYLIRCTSTSPSGHPGCWRGLAAVGAGLVLFVGGGLFAGDIYVSRRRRLLMLKENPL